jgi:hypothetical protein
MNAVMEDPVVVCGRSDSFVSMLFDNGVPARATFVHVPDTKWYMQDVVHSATRSHPGHAMCKRRLLMEFAEGIRNPLAVQL